MMDYQKQCLRVVSVLLVTVVGLSSPSLAENTLVFGGLPNINPLSFEEDGVVKGFFSDVFRETARRAGFTITLKLYPIKRLEAYLQAGKLDGAVHLTHTPERDKYLTFLPTPLRISRTLVFVKKGREFPFHSVEDLEGKTVGVLLGWKAGRNTAFERAVQAGTIKIEPVVKVEQDLKKLMAGRVDCIIGTEQLTWYHANRLGVAKELAALETPIDVVTVFSAISTRSKNIPDPQEFIKKMDAALNEIMSDGTYKALQEKYHVTSLK